MAQLTDTLRQIREARNSIDGQEAAAATARAEMDVLEKRLRVAEQEHRALADNTGRTARDLYIKAAAVPESLLPLWKSVRAQGVAPATDPSRSPAPAELTGARQRLTDLRRTLADRRGQVTAYTAAVEGGKSLVAQLEKSSDELRRQVDASVQAALRATPTADAAAGSYVGGRLAQPVKASLTSPFGDRFDPYYRRWQLHAGIDLAAPMNAPITAAAGGRVTQAGPLGGYGNFTCVEHGLFEQQRLTTCYAHQVRILVTVGQQVAAGQLIGLVGSTGASTGPHLHFEVRLGGRAVNPLVWLAS